MQWHFDFFIAVIGLVLLLLSMEQEYRDLNSDSTELVHCSHPLAPAVMFCERD